MSGSGRGPIPDICEFSGDLPKFAGVVGSPSRKSRSGREALPNVREALPNVQEYLKYPLRFTGVVGRSSWCVRKWSRALSDVR